jgi:hypothetical protein
MLGQTISPTYADVLGFSTIIDDPAGRFVFMRAPASDNHHDIAFFTIGSGAGDSEAGQRTVGMYHLAWEVPTLEELEEMRDRLGRSSNRSISPASGRTSSAWGLSDCGDVRARRAPHRARGDP